ncbi:MAG: hypothetical protein JWQ57_4991, partial [Mucilaginibacter sp.]|nr:hypothetical protein [Mucilaginibacter sp.]
VKIKEHICKIPNPLKGEQNIKAMIFSSPFLFNIAAVSLLLTNEI